MVADLRASEAKFSGILAIAADAIVTVDKAERIVHFNDGASTAFTTRTWGDLPSRRCRRGEWRSGVR